MKANRALRVRSEQGAVGIGTLIVFIATILVAAVAAAVLIDTSNSLQEKAQRTGQEATAQVATNLDVVKVTGNNDGAGGDLEWLNITIQLAPGARQLDLSQLILRISDGAAEYNLVWVDGDPSATEYSVTDLRDEDSSFTSAVPVMTPGDLVTIWVDLTSSTGIDMPLGPRTNVEVELIPEVGTSVHADFRTPATYATDSVFTLR